MDDFAAERVSAGADALTDEAAARRSIVFGARYLAGDVLDLVARYRLLEIRRRGVELHYLLGLLPQRGQERRQEEARRMRQVDAFLQVGQMPRKAGRSLAEVQLAQFAQGAFLAFLRHHLHIFHVVTEPLKDLLPEFSGEFGQVLQVLHDNLPEHPHQRTLVEHDLSVNDTAVDQLPFAGTEVFGRRQVGGVVNLKLFPYRFHGNAQLLRNVQQCAGFLALQTSFGPQRFGHSNPVNHFRVGLR